MLQDSQQQWDLLEMRGDIEFPALNISSQGVVNRYKTHYVVKLCRNAVFAQREMSFLAAAKECAVDVLGPVHAPYGGGGFVMPLLTTIDTTRMTLQDKIHMFHEMRYLLQSLHEKQIIHGDIKLSNMLLDNEGR